MIPNCPNLSIVFSVSPMASSCIHRWSGINILSGLYLRIHTVEDDDTWWGYWCGVVDVQCHTVTLVQPLTLTLSECFL